MRSGVIAKILNIVGNQINPATEEKQDDIISLFSSISRIPSGKSVSKIGFWEDSDGNIRYIKFYDGEEVLFTLEFSNAGTASSETWSITRI